MPQFDLGGDLGGYKLVPVCQQIQITQSCQCSKEGGQRGTAKHFPTVDKRHRSQGLLLRHLIIFLKIKRKCLLLIQYKYYLYFRQKIDIQVPKALFVAEYMGGVWEVRFSCAFNDIL